MFRDEKNLKDSTKDTIKDTSNMPAPYQAAGFGSGSYTKANKLITALYMVTDIVYKDEPLRNKLRTLGVGILSDINSSPSQACPKINELMSFLDIASTMNIISQMNCGILKKEFSELDHSIKESTGRTIFPGMPINLEEFLRDKPSISGKSTHLGIQKGSTLMKALSRVEVSDRNNQEARPSALGFASRAQRREEILNIIKAVGGNATIKDIKDKISIMSDKETSLNSCSEKTLQRELISMVQNDVLYREGAKRWSRYFVKTTPP